MTIDDILTKHGSDKATWHRYGPVYDQLFPDREAVTAVLEIGVAGGASILAWREAFPNAQIIGLDKNPVRLWGERIQILQGDQGCRQDINRCAAHGPFDLIVDDASHIIHDQLTCLFWLWPHLKPGGYYVIEEFDIQTGGGPRANLDSYGLLWGLQLHRTPSPNGEEILVVVEKKDKPERWDDKSWT